MAEKPNSTELTADLARKLLRYDPETGLLYWRARPVNMFTTPGHAKMWNKRFAGSEAFTALAAGYRMGRVFDRPHLAHRVIWLIQTGTWPNDQIDHVNGIKTDNRWSNIRDTTPAENMRNISIRRTNISGVNGVQFNRRRNKWQARIKLPSGEKFLGYFDSIEEAASARAAANDEYGFSKRHGKSA